METSPRSQPTRRSALQLGIAAAGSAALAAALASCAAPKTVTTPKRKPEDHHLPAGWVARNEVHATNGQGSYLADNIVVSSGVVTMRAIVDPGRSAGSDVTSSKHHFGSAIDGPTFMYGTINLVARLPWAKDPASQIAKPVLILWPQNDNDAPKKIELDFLEVSTSSAMNGRADVNLNYGQSWKNKGNESSGHTLDDAWHRYTVKWTAESVQVLVDGKPLLQSKTKDEIPVGPHRIIFQVDFDSIDSNAPENKARTMNAIEIKDVSIKTTEKSFAPVFG